MVGEYFSLIVGLDEWLWMFVVLGSEVLDCELERYASSLMAIVSTKKTEPGSFG